MPTSKKTTTPQKTIVAASTPVAKEVRYFNKNLKISPRKLRLLATQVKKLNPFVALDQLKFTNSKAARILLRSIGNVIADAKNNFHLDTSSLRFSSIRVDEGMKIKRMDKSHGSRFNRGLIQKRHSRIEIILSGQTN
jgi:large subunit ribosomal protein L22